MYTNLSMSALKLLCLSGLLRGFMVMQSQARCSSTESGAKTTGTLKLAPALIGIPAAMTNRRHTSFSFSA